MSTKPFLKWAGGKRRLLPILKAQFPTHYEAFIEPFVGGAAAFFDVAPSCSLIADKNLRLVRTYVAVRDQPQAVINILSSYKNDESSYLAVRDSGSLDSGNDAEAAATFIYLNKAGFNGLYRENRQGRFNTPYGHNAGGEVCDAVTLRACSAALQGASIEHASFEDTIDRADAGDFVYCDPPYSSAKSASFTGYTANGFGASEHARLRDIALKAKQRDVQVLISNSDTPQVRALYANPIFRIVPIQAPRNIAANPNRRGTASEVLIANY